MGALLWHIEQEVRLGNNRTCTSKKQKWSVPSKKQSSLHGPDVLNNIGIKKSKPENILYSDVPAKRLRHDFDPRSENYRFISAFIENEIDLLSDITKGNCGIVALLRTPSAFPINIDTI